MQAERIEQSRAGRIDATEALNAVAAEEFRGLADDIPLWRFRDVLTKLGTELGLSGGTVVYALDLMGLLTEADWRGDGRAVTYHSIRTYARKVGKSERTICGYERQLIIAGLAHRTVKHARRHGGMGNEARRTGLDWRAFGARLPMLLDLLERRVAEEQCRLDLEARIRTSRRTVLGLIAALIDREGHIASIEQDYARADVSRLRNTMTLVDLERRHAALTLLQNRLIDVLGHERNNPTVDNHRSSAQLTIQSEDSGGLIDTTDIPPCPTDIRRLAPFAKSERQIRTPKRPERTRCLEKSSSERRPTARRYFEVGADSTMREPRNTETLPTLGEIWKAAPQSWKTALGSEIDITWPILIDLARHFTAKLGVSAHTWHKALNVLGPSEAALALIVLDRNRDHPSRPVRSVGGALTGMIRRAEEGAFNLAPSVFGILTRSQGTDRRCAG